MVKQHEEIQKSLTKFLEWFETCDGDEKQESQLFFENLVQAFGNAGVKQIGAKCELPVTKREGKGKRFADFVWSPRVVIELKSRGEPLQKHFNQVLDYWNTICPKLKYMVLCNFDEFWIYDPNVQMYDPIHILKTKDLLREWQALAFLRPTEEKPVFNNNHVEITEDVAKIVGNIYLSLSKRKVPAEKAQRFVLQIVVALFAEDVGLIPPNTLYQILSAATGMDSAVTEKELTTLFKAMAIADDSKKPRKYRDIPYFNGGIFSEIEPVELSYEELTLLMDACKFDWSKVRPSIFGSIFEGSTDENHRHGHGIHYTSELDIQKIVSPTIVRPFEEKILNAKSKKELKQILKEIIDFRVLDPACGSGNFLYVAFRELRRLEVKVLEALGEDIHNRGLAELNSVSPRNFFGIDTNTFALELAKISLSIGRKLSSDELGLHDNVLPFDNLDENFQNKDALLEAKWPMVDAIIGNPPFQSRRTMQEELGVPYINKLRDKFPKISGNSDYCVYWFRKAHDHLEKNKSAGLVGTNTIRQNYSREGGLDYIVQSDGEITEAVSTQVWSGNAAVHVSIVNWLKGKSGIRNKKLFFQKGDNVDSPWEVFEVAHIPSTLSINTDVTTAQLLQANIVPKRCFQGQTHGHAGFLLKPAEAKKIDVTEKPIGKVLFPYLTGDELVGNINGTPKRFVIDFGTGPITDAMKYTHLFKLVKENVFKDRKEKAEKEKKRNTQVFASNIKAKVNKHHQNFFKRWWQLSWPREDLIEKIATVSRYIACSATTKRQIFEFVSSEIHPNAKLQVFVLEDDYSFGIISSSLHWKWLVEKCTTLKGDFSYNEKSIWDTFPWPQTPSQRSIKQVAKAAIELRQVRYGIMKTNKWSLRNLYRSLELPGKNPLRDAHDNLDKAVREAYGMKDKEDILKFLLDLNLQLANKESLGETIVGPGLPPIVKDAKPFITDDCINMEY